jgi:diadenosine tetraphosphatase ApaH/serine/threonine PP2A family protein phosphatase
MNPTARQAMEWTRAQLNAEQMSFLRNLPYRIELHDLLLVHANAWAPEKWEYIDGVMEAMRSMHQSAITFCGHMHVPTLYHMTMTGKTGEFLPTPENPYR